MGSGRKSGVKVYDETQTSPLTDPQTTTQPDIWTYLKHLRDMVQNLGTIVVEQREELSITKTELTCYKSQADKLELKIWNIVIFLCYQFSVVNHVISKPMTIY